MATWSKSGSGRMTRAAVSGAALCGTQQELCGALTLACLPASCTVAAPATAGTLVGVYDVDAAAVEDVFLHVLGQVRGKT